MGDQQWYGTQFVTDVLLETKSKKIGFKKMIKKWYKRLSGLLSLKYENVFCLQGKIKENKKLRSRLSSVTDMELEDSSGAHRMVLPVHLDLFCLCVLRLQWAAAQEVDTVREAQLPALGVSFKVHHKGLNEGTQGQHVRRRKMDWSQEISGHKQTVLKEPTRSRA